MVVECILKVNIPRELPERVQLYIPLEVLVRRRHKVILHPHCSKEQADSLCAATYCKVVEGGLLCPGADLLGSLRAGGSHGSTRTSGKG